MSGFPGCRWWVASVGVFASVLVPSAGATLPRVVIEPVADVEPTGEGWVTGCDVAVPCPWTGPLISEMATFGDEVAFEAFNHGLGRELWVTDGTREGTRLVEDLCPDSCDSRPRPRFEIDEQLVFVADTSGGWGDWGLLATDGNAVRDLGPDLPTFYSYVTPHYAEVGGWRYFGSRDRVLRTDGFLVEDVVDFDGTGTVVQVFTLGEATYARRYLYQDDLAEVWRILPDVERVLTGCEDQLFRSPHILGDVAVFYAACLEELPASGSGLYRTDGTVEGTYWLAETLPTSFWIEGNVAYYLDPWNSGAEARRIWRTDGTLEGTFPLTPLVPGLYELVGVVRGRYLLARFGSRLQAWDLESGGMRDLDIPSGTVHVFPATGHAAVLRSSYGIWLTDGTPEGTRKAFDLADGVSVTSSVLFEKDRVLFGLSAFGYHNTELPDDDLWSLRVIPASVEIPTLSQGTMAFLAMLLAVVALNVLRRRSASRPERT